MSLQFECRHREEGFIIWSESLISHILFIVFSLTEVNFIHNYIINMVTTLREHEQWT